MNKYLNKGLVYEWFNAAKIPIIIGLVSWGFIAHSFLSSIIIEVKESIGTSESSDFTTIPLNRYFILGIIFLAIYIFASGNNKRNTTMFLCSGPHTKKQIKFNELICLLMTLVLFIIMYIYMVITIYVRNNELMTIINGFIPIILIEILRLLLFGIIGILLMIEIDLLFSNTIIAYFGMMSLILSTLFIWSKLRDIISYFGNYGSLMDQIFGGIVYGNGYRNEYLRRLSILFFDGGYHSEDIYVIARGIIFSIAVIIVMMLIFNLLEKRAKLETTSKIFSSKINENIIVSYLSLGAGICINMLFLELFLRRWIYRVIGSEQQGVFDSIKVLSTDIIILTMSTFISYKLLKKILKVIG